ncbi:MAG: hypothetical protein D3926_14015 [Desulfobacteraceae bacterium]|nr:MAG: hypothetical protein D3926_14015 [Desulfobacteraceae bacterium]
MTGNNNGFSIIIFVAAAALFLWGCASSGQKFIHLDFQHPISKTRSGRVGIEPFQDKRQNMGPGYLGYRTLLDNSRETFFVTGLDLSRSLTHVTSQYIQACGFDTEETSFEHTPEGVGQSSTNFTYILAGQINDLEYTAVKKAGRTHVGLVIDLTLYLGEPATATLKTIPVSMTLDQVAFNLDRKKVEEMLNQSIQEVLVKSLALDTPAAE